MTCMTADQIELLTQTSEAEDTSSISCRASSVSYVVELS